MQGRGQRGGTGGCPVLGVPCMPASHCADNRKSGGSQEGEGSGSLSANCFASSSHSKCLPSTNSLGYKLLTCLTTAEKSAGGGWRWGVSGGWRKSLSCERSLSRSKEPSLLGLPYLCLNQPYIQYLTSQQEAVMIHPQRDCILQDE